MTWFAQKAYSCDSFDCDHRQRDPPSSPSRRGRFSETLRALAVSSLVESIFVIREKALAISDVSIFLADKLISISYSLLVGA